MDEGESWVGVFPAQHCFFPPWAQGALICWTTMIDGVGFCDS